jgi:hypothetical protein
MIATASTAWWLKDAKSKHEQIAKKMVRIMTSKV